MIERLKPGAEFCIVVVVAFAYFTVSSVLVALSMVPNTPIDRNGLVGLVLYECIVLAILSPILRVRGWTLAELGLRGRASDVLVAFAFVVAFHAANTVLWSLAGGLGVTVPIAGDAVPISRRLSFPAIAMLCVVNPIFEEIFACAYVVRALGRMRSPWFAINASVAIRLSYHLYQGDASLMGVLPMGLMSALWFARTGRLWSIVIAHAIVDFAALAPYA